ncbi:hypothetical protein SDRG_12807 [Saprolegnia diclina VS20]|uniref:Ubiquitin carboxyl-terminal hydrolase n=1 Tax=Saprolegnia diclina (strain VS20) TaxID=1156394 RepID=T0RBK8_SAPDV|nr:hypothetical protein SDRG_12807 [Saprolegnia diclina VS20]EQC29558.1 hypothetical protein SDRG_12807 [Saprolegnia diclina VS20]|eukprot:XP_008617110.1 hypothetical protein SDRG_12807 [Saprolegnia diclina VS20]
MHRFNANHLQDVAAARAAAADAKFQAEFPHLHRAEMRRKAKVALATPTRAPVTKRVPAKPTTAPVATKHTTVKPTPSIKSTRPVKPTLLSKPVSRPAPRKPKVLAPATTSATKPSSSPSPAPIRPARSSLVVSRPVAPTHEPLAAVATTETPVLACSCQPVIVALEDENRRLQEELRAAHVALAEYASKVQHLEAALLCASAPIDTMMPPAAAIPIALDAEPLASPSEDNAVDTAPATMTPTAAPLIPKVAAENEPHDGAATTKAAPTPLSTVSRSPIQLDASHAGLANLGNTCYMNATLQCLAHAPPLVDALLSQQSESTTVNALTRVVSGILANDAASYRSDQEALVPHFHSASTQQDASDYLAWLVSDLEVTSTIPEDVFGSYWTATSTCPHCGLQSETSDAYRDISIAEETTSVAAGLASFATKTLTRTCDNCHIFGTSKQHWTILLAPPVLVLTLSATNYNVQDARRVVVNEMLALGASTYRLVGLVGHRGTSVFGGHYVAYVRRSNDWLCMNDALVSVVSARTVFAQRAYVLFYERLADDS